MRRVLKKSGSLYLHCDPTASHYIKILMDSILGRKNFRNEIVWCYTGPSNTKSHFPRKHDIILFYAGQGGIFNKDKVRVRYKESSFTMGGSGSFTKGSSGRDHKHGASEQLARGKVVEDYWTDIPALSVSKERLGYPTQKPAGLLERIIRASSKRDGVILDPFCGCGTAIYAAEKLGRRWIGIDISPFATGLVRQRVYRQCNLRWKDVRMLGIPETPEDAKSLASQDKFEFEKWACGHVGAEGMFHQPGTRGADRGVDGMLKFYPLYEGRKPKPHYAIVQVKGGGVSPDAVRALYATVKNFDAKAGVMLCFENQMSTVENNRNRDTFNDLTGTYPVIQGLSVEKMLRGQSPKLPNLLKAA